MTEVGTGIILLAMIIGYLPMIDQAYAQREVGVQWLESRAKSPQSAVHLLRRFGRPESAETLDGLMKQQRSLDEAQRNLGIEIDLFPRISSGLQD